MNKQQKIKELTTQYELISNEILQMFCDKQELDFDFWVADEVGSLASFEQYFFFNLSDIILDLTTNQPKGFIQQWQLDNTNLREHEQYINYKSYIMGVRHGGLKEIPKGVAPF